MAVYMTRNPHYPGAENGQNLIGPWRYYQNGYSSTGAQEAIFLPDVGKIGVQLSGTFNCDVEVSCSPPSKILAGSGDVWFKPTSPGTVSAATVFSLEAVTAFRLKMNSGSVLLEVIA